MLTTEQAFDIAESLRQSADEARTIAKQFPKDKRQAKAAQNIAVMRDVAFLLYKATRKYADEWGKP